MGGGEGGCVSEPVRWELRGLGELSSRSPLAKGGAGDTPVSARGYGDWLRPENYTCGGRGVRLHVNQALYKFCLCLVEELNRQTPPPRTPGKKQVLLRQQEDR